MITSEEKNYLFQNCKDLLVEYGYHVTDEGLNKILDTWAQNKSDLIEMFKTHPNYIPGRFMITLDTDVRRDVDVSTVDYFWNWIRGIVSQINDGKPVYLREPYETYRNEEDRRYLPQKIYDLICCSPEKTFNAQFISNELSAKLAEIMPEIHPHPGAKTSRTINKIMQTLGYSDAPDYNKMFAKYADAINPLMMRKKVILSLNPLDYYTMSFGNSWASCHTIDKENRRGMPNAYHGQYSSGTESYMLDETSFVTYTIENDDAVECWKEPKVSRQMFHYSEGTLVQGRMYPQSNDSNDSCYGPSRAVVQQVIADCLDRPNLWTLERDTIENYVYSEGTHYRDYIEFSNCTISFLQSYSSPRRSQLTIGHHPICPCCGDVHDYGENIMCYECEQNDQENDDDDYVICENCGTELLCWDAYEINGSFFCSECAGACEDCGDIHECDDLTYVESENRTVCESCLESHYYQCFECNEYHSSQRPHNQPTWVQSIHEFVCQSCLEDNYIQCTKCHEYFEMPDEPFDGEYICENCKEDDEQ